MYLRSLTKTAGSGSISQRSVPKFHGSATLLKIFPVLAQKSGQHIRIFTMEEIVWLADAAHRLQGHRLRLLEQRRPGPRRKGGLVMVIGRPRPPPPQLRRANSSPGGEFGPAGRRHGGQGGRRRHRVADRGRCRAWGVRG